MSPRADRKLRAVVIDDNDDLRMLMADLLESFGHEVYAAAEGNEGLRLVVDVRPDVALVDLSLPGLDGCSIATAIRAHAQLSKLRLVAMTGRSGEDDRVRALSAGFDVHLVKPATAAAILAALDGYSPRLRGSGGNGGMSPSSAR